jgi:hypothetical protein
MTQYIDRKEMLVFLTDLRSLIDTTIQRLSSVPIVTAEQPEPSFVEETGGFVPIGDEPLANHPNDPIVNLNRGKMTSKNEIAPGVYSNRPLTPKQAILEAKLVPIISKLIENPMSIIENDPLTK